MQSLNRPINQSMNQSSNQSFIQSIMQPINQSVGRSVGQPTNQPINQSINQSVSQSVNQSISQWKMNVTGKPAMVKLSTVSLFFLSQTTFLSHLNVLSFMSRSFQMFIAMATVSGMINPFLAMCIAGLNSSFHGNLPYFFHAASKPRSSPGTATANPPVNEDK